MTGKGRGRVKRRSPPSLGNILSLSGPQHGENFGYTILGAIGLLVFVGVKTFHTASPRSALSDAGHFFSRRAIRRHPFAPLPEEEWDPRRGAFVPDLARPARVHRSGPGPDLAASYDPVERPPGRSLKGRWAASVNGVVVAPKGIEVTVTDGDGLWANLVEQRLEADPSYRGRSLQQIADPRQAVLVLDRDAEPEIAQWPGAGRARRSCSRHRPWPAAAGWQRQGWEEVGVLGNTLRRLRIVVIGAHPLGPLGQHQKPVPMRRPHHRMHQIKGRCRQVLVKQIRHQADGDAPGTAPEKRPRQQILGNPHFAGPYRAGPLRRGKPGITSPGFTAHSRELRRDPHCVTVVASGADERAARCRVPGRVEPIDVFRPSAPSAVAPAPASGS